MKVVLLKSLVLLAVAHNGAHNNIGPIIGTSARRFAFLFTFLIFIWSAMVTGNAKDNDAPNLLADAAFDVKARLTSGSWRLVDLRHPEITLAVFTFATDRTVSVKSKSKLTGEGAAFGKARTWKIEEGMIRLFDASKEVVNERDALYKTSNGWVIRFNWAISFLGGDFTDPDITSIALIQ